MLAEVCVWNFDLLTPPVGLSFLFLLEFRRKSMLGVCYSHCRIPTCRSRPGCSRNCTTAAARHRRTQAAADRRRWVVADRRRWAVADQCVRSVDAGPRRRVAVAPSCSRAVVCTCCPAAGCLCRLIAQRSVGQCWSAKA